MVTSDCIMLRECPFCMNVHTSPYVDEVEEIVLRCRDKAAPEQRGTLDAWEGRETQPVRSEIEALRGGP